MLRLSGDKVSTTVSREKSLTDQCSVLRLKPGQYAAVVYDMRWYVGFIEEKCAEVEEIYARFMHHSEKGGYLFWPQRKEQCWVPSIHILTLVSVPTASGSSARQCRLSDEEVKRMEKCVEHFFSKLTSFHK